MSKEEKGFIKVEVEGLDKERWFHLRSKFIRAINNTLDSVIDHENNSTIRDEGRKFTSALLDYGKSKLQKAGLENDELIAQVDLLYSQKEKELAEARKLNAEAETIEFQNNIKKLKLSIKGMKVLMIGNPGEEEMLFLKQMDAFLEVLRELEDDNNFHLPG